MDSDIVDFLYQAQSEVLESFPDTDSHGPMGGTLVALARIPLHRESKKAERRAPSADRAAWSWSDALPS